MDLKERLYNLMSEHVTVLARAENITEEEVLLEWIKSIAEATAELITEGDGSNGNES